MSGLALALASFASFASLASAGGCATSVAAFTGDDGGPEGGNGVELDAAIFGDSDTGDSSVVGGPRIACGSTFCRSDEKCVQGACNFDCTGTKVPGDYATITAAVTALAATGNDVTICLGAIQAGESVSVSDPGAHNKTLKIIGTVPLLTTLGTVSVSSGFSEVTLQGFGTSSSASIQGASKVTLRALKLQSASSAALTLRGASTTLPSTVVVDGCDIGNSTTSGYGISIDNSLTAPFNVAITSSYIHGGSYGVYVSGTTGTQFSLSLVNNTIDKTQYGLYVSAAPTSPITYVNNIVSNATQSGIFIQTGMTAVTHANNALFGNMNNYSGGAVDGTAYVKSDCMLDMTTGVPQTHAGSPCRGAGRAMGAPATDFWNSPRGAAVDIGAVQGP